MKATKLGMKKSQIKQVDGTTINHASAKVNLLSITALLSQGFVITKDKRNNIMVSINDKKVIMDG